MCVLRSIGEPCRREPLEKQDEKCDRGLICLKGDDSWYCENMKPENVKVSRCRKKRGKIDAFDQVTRKSYRIGEIWIRGDFACTALGNIPGCRNPARVEGRCCKFCLDSDEKKSKCAESEGLGVSHDSQHMDPLSESHSASIHWTSEILQEGRDLESSVNALTACVENTRRETAPQFVVPDRSVTIHLKSREYAVQCVRGITLEVGSNAVCCPVCPRDYARVGAATSNWQCSKQQMQVHKDDKRAINDETKVMHKN
ncbi:hypothetical protein OS493_037777 [Desmophyllum pertusum]|uniref:Uncharacterized protein n=1 Tax=Desmophyllum pertusum TaxID=174260 RepID=A0A9X0CJG7_9CNID|nr:hypothetical protein OS493_037777 [Desmophyllum pertusum]